MALPFIVSTGKSIASMANTLLLKDGKRVPILGLGVYKANERSLQCVLDALKVGYRHVDTAACYHNEAEVGSAVRKSGIPRDEVYITTKLWNTDHGYDAAIKACKESLQRLGLPYVDLYLMHSPLGGKVVETWDAMVELQKGGLVRSIGVSNFNVHHLEELKKVRPHNIPVMNQIELSPFLTRTELVSYCQKEGIVVTAYSPLTQGAKLNDPQLVAIANRYGKSVAQLLIRWCIQQGFVCIPKSVREERIRENGEVFDFSISDQDMQAMSDMNENLCFSWNPLTSPWEG